MKNRDLTEDPICMYKWIIKSLWIIFVSKLGKVDKIDKLLEKNY